MEIFYTPEDIENEYGIETKILANWRANLIGPDCIKWKDKIFYHSQEIEEWFEAKDIDAHADPEENLNSESETKPETENEPESERVSEPITAPETEPDPGAIFQYEIEHKYLTPQDVEEMFGVNTKTLANWRCQGKGPEYFKLGNKIRYHIEKIRKWLGAKESELETDSKQKPDPKSEFDSKPGCLDDFLSPKEVGEKFQIKEQTLANWRSQGRGPKYQKFGNKVYYHIDGIDKWIATSRVRIYERKKP